MTFHHSNGLAESEWASLFDSWFNPPVESGPQFASPVAVFSFGRESSTTIATGGTSTTVGNVRQPLILTITKKTLLADDELQWNTLAHAGYSDLTAQHNRVLREVAHIMLPVYRPSPVVDITHESTCALWKAVDILRSSNIAMTFKKQPVVFREEPVYLGFNSQQDEQGGWRIRARLLTSHPLPAAEESAGVDDFTVLGTDYHGLAWKVDDTLHLAPLNATPPAPWLQLALRGGVDVPAAEAARFADEVLPKLSPTPSV